VEEQIASIFWTESSIEQQTNVKVLFANFFHTRFLLGLFFDTEDGGDIPPKLQFTFS
jgi:hypothetical protein